MASTLDKSSLLFVVGANVDEAHQYGDLDRVAWDGELEPSDIRGYELAFMAEAILVRYSLSDTIASQTLGSFVFRNYPFGIRTLLTLTDAVAYGSFIWQPYVDTLPGRIAYGQDYDQINMFSLTGTNHAGEEGYVEYGIPIPFSNGYRSKSLPVGKMSIYKAIRMTNAVNVGIDVFTLVESIKAKMTDSVKVTIKGPEESNPFGDDFINSTIRKKGYVSYYQCSGRWNREDKAWEYYFVTSEPSSTATVDLDSIIPTIQRSKRAALSRYIKNYRICVLMSVEKDEYYWAIYENPPPPVYVSSLMTYVYEDVYEPTGDSGLGRFTIPLNLHDVVTRAMSHFGMTQNIPTWTPEGDHGEFPPSFSDNVRFQILRIELIGYLDERIRIL